MQNGFYYLNNTGSRWRIIGDKVRLVVPQHNYSKVRVVDHYEQFGNFATTHLKYRGRMVGGFPLSFDRDPDGHPILVINITQEAA